MQTHILIYPENPLLTWTFMKPGERTQATIECLGCSGI